MSQTLVEPTPPRPAAPSPGSRGHGGIPDRPQHESSGENWMFFAVILAVLALIAAIFAVGLSARAVDDSEPSSPPAATGGPAPTSVAVALSEFAIAPKDLTVAPGGTLQVTNNGTLPHNFVVRGTGLATPMLKAGEKTTLSLGDLLAGTYEVICDVPGHDAAGMRATLHVAASVGVAGNAQAPSPQASTANATVDFSATPGPAWRAFDPTLRPAQGGTVHDVTIRVTEQVMEVAPGVRQELWTFNGQVPGPVLRGRVGDVFNVTLVNDGRIGHSIDFHASEVAPGTEMRTIQRGESLLYQFRAEHAGIWMYHCGTAPALHHIGNGMYGAVIIDPPGLPPVDREFVMVQSELYLGPPDQPGDLAKMVDVRPDAVAFNGYVNQYRFTPVRVEPGQVVRVWVLDAGPSENSSFHIVGTVFDTVFKEGAYLLKPDGSRGGAQALDLQPAQGGFVEFTLDRPGQFPMVTHKFANVGKGALGLFQAGG